MEPRNRFQPQAYVACCAGTTILFDVRCNRFLVSINVYNSGSGKFDCFLWFVFLSFLSCLTENVAQWRKKFSLRIYDSEVLFLDRISTFYEAFISPFKRRYCISEILHFLDGNLAKKIGWNKSRTPEIATICQADSKWTTFLHKLLASANNDKTKFLRNQCWNFIPVSMGDRNRVGLGLSYRPTWARICNPFKTSPRFDSQPSRPIQQPHLSCRPAKLHRLAEKIPRSDFWAS